MQKFELRIPNLMQLLVVRSLLPWTQKCDLIYTHVVVMFSVISLPKTWYVEMNEFYGKHALILLWLCCGRWPKRWTNRFKTSARKPLKTCTKFVHSMQVLHINFKLNLNIYLKYLPIFFFFVHKISLLCSLNVNFSYNGMWLDTFKPKEEHSSKHNKHWSLCQVCEIIL